MNLKKIAALTLTAALAVTTFASCGEKPASSTAGPVASTPASSAAAQEPVTIKVSTWDYTANATVSNVVAAFEKANPNIKVEIIDIVAADYTNKLSVMLNGGSDLDAYFIKDADTTKSMVDKGQVLDITEYIKKDGVDLAGYNGLADNFVFGGKNYGLPARTDYYVLYYNKDIFDAAKVAYPTNDMTWKQFEETAKKLTQGEGTTKKYGAFLHTWQALVQNWGVQDGKHTMMDTDYSFFKPYYEMALRMQNEDKSIMDYGELTSNKIHYSGPFPKGEIGMMPMGTWYMATQISKDLAKESSIKWGIATLPHPDGVAAGTTIGSATPLVINAASKKADAAWEFVKFATGDEGAMEYAKAGGIPGRANDKTLAGVAGMPGMPEGTLEALGVKQIYLDRPIADNVGEVNKMLGEKHGLIMLGEKTIDEGLAEMAARSKEIQGK